MMALLKDALENQKGAQKAQKAAQESRQNPSLQRKEKIH
jgi:hypothetical protein